MSEGAIPEATRWKVYERDKKCCRLCGMNVEGGWASVHHIVYRSQGGTNDITNLILLCGSGSSGCHLKAHSNKGLWEPILRELITRKGVTGLQLKRWMEKKSGATDHRRTGP